MALIIIANPLVDHDDVRERAGQTDNTEIQDSDIDQMILQASGLVLSHVASRYDINKFTDELLTDWVWTVSPTLNILTSIELELASSILLLKFYWAQRLTENNNAQAMYDLQMSLLKDIRDGQLRLLDIRLYEFPLLPLKPWKTVPWQIVSSFNDTDTIPAEKVFKTDQIR